LAHTRLIGGQIKVVLTDRQIDVTAESFGRRQCRYFALWIGEKALESGTEKLARLRFGKTRAIAGLDRLP